MVLRVQNETYVQVGYMRSGQQGAVNPCTFGLSVSHVRCIAIRREAHASIRGTARVEILRASGRLCKALDDPPELSFLGHQVAVSRGGQLE